MLVQEKLTSKAPYINIENSDVNYWDIRTSDIFCSLSMPLQINSFFEFNERLEAILTKAYIYRWATAWWYLPVLHGILSSLCFCTLITLSSFLETPPYDKWTNVSVSQGDTYDHLPSLLSPLQCLSVLLGLCLQRTRINTMGVQWRGQQVDMW